MVYIEMKISYSDILNAGIRNNINSASAIVK